jgi:hypothetical protein
VDIAACLRKFKICMNLLVLEDGTLHFEFDFCFITDLLPVVKEKYQLVGEKSQFFLKLKFLRPMLKFGRNIYRAVHLNADMGWIFIGIDDGHASMNKYGLFTVFYEG